MYFRASVIKIPIMLALNSMFFKVSIIKILIMLALYFMFQKASIIKKPIMLALSIWIWTYELFKNWQKNYKWWSDPVVFWNALDPVVILFAKNMYVHSKNHKFKINHFWTGPSAFQRKITTGSDHHLYFFCHIMKKIATIGSRANFLSPDSNGKGC